LNNLSFLFFSCKLWSELCPDTEVPRPISREWEHVGFQGVNPATDFRSTGMKWQPHTCTEKKKEMKMKGAGNII
jgi:hypothetical protein